MTAPADQRDDRVFDRGRAFLGRHPTVDIHAHPGRFFMRGAVPTPFVARYPAPEPEAAVADVRAGGVTAVAFATVADLSVLAFRPNGLGAGRPLLAGEAIDDHHHQLALLDGLQADQGLVGSRSGAAIAEAHRDGDTVMLRSVEGGDFIEDRLDRIAEAAARGVSSITLIHYCTNQIGDTQTEAATHGGLTPLGRATVAAMEGAGILVDIAHASSATARDVVDAATRPVLLSHSNVAFGDARHPRLVSPDDARMVADTGGLIGAVSAGFDQQTIGDYVDTICRMVDLVGDDHVAIGTDMDFTYRPVFTSYRDWPLLAGLVDERLGEVAAAKVLGGNMMRLLA